MASWTCPYCGQIATEKAVPAKAESMVFREDTRYGTPIMMTSLIEICPNDECKEIVVSSGLSIAKIVDGQWTPQERLDVWKLRPQAAVKVFPDYIPKAILDDYKEAALICNLSPKASATLARRCIQGMIRDFWAVKAGRLVDEINAIEGQVDHGTWEAINAIRSIGNIGAHMERDINLIVDVEPEEAELLIQLIEVLLKDWYVEREERHRRTSKIVELAKAKQAERKATQN
ncbi:DUF4145 domain-containing protein [Serratia marcescens]|uniref:DUF4145 domain-containing protein n=1 Tax=Serratia marcescens TaxID=615 RepID=UPI002768D883|nr:DUF4145 domain-containing protein [Serratia marcescens]MDP8650085.1 DUF4145 domain-containing protein [Serratia marcescens]MDP8664938.1 DUF4145 domain-containing protein [Serratia marcescens]MDP8739069.1 DUF4145 domain-containing protein [Serratia marcescens]MDP8813555.1 DUF4145 domain-containing protein [Serratia marcescens]HEJ7160054.1 DUF4145 domain-containing protein [Serratia marcescens]